MARALPGRLSSRPGWFAFFPLATLAVFLLPIAAGLLGTLLPAFGYLPALGGREPSLTPWRDLLAAPGLGTAVRQALDIGIPEIGRRSAYLGARLRDSLAATAGVTVHDLGRERCAIVTAKVAGVDTADVAEALKAQGINVTTTVAEHNQFDTRNIHPLVRLSPHYYNTEDEIDQAIVDLRATME